MQKIDGLFNIADTLKKLRDEDPQECSRRLRGFLMGLANAPVDSRRSEHINRMNEIDEIVPRTQVLPGIPEAVRSFEDFLPRRLYPDVQKARDMVWQWSTGQGPAILTLTGGTGTGKSHLAIAAAQRLYNLGLDVVYREETDFLAELRRGIDDNTKDDRIQQFENCTHLVIDDLGVTNDTPFVRENLDRLINARWRDAPRRRTLITTNLLSHELPVRIGSRLSDVELARAIAINANDYRRERSGGRRENTSNGQKKRSDS